MSTLNELLEKKEKYKHLLGKEVKSDKDLSPNLVIGVAILPKGDVTQSNPNEDMFDETKDNDVCIIMQKGHLAGIGLKTTVEDFEKDYTIL
ncbi:MAG TPA: hypothetical protein VJY62_00020 [Bacteroidia bacterium]|nr:hypothetical protein [Bacteroidia bacterium]